jgi:hypothetical protein
MDPARHGARLGETAACQCPAVGQRRDRAFQYVINVPDDPSYPITPARFRVRVWVAGKGWVESKPVVLEASHFHPVEGPSPGLHE